MIQVKASTRLAQSQTTAGTKIQAGLKGSRIQAIVSKTFQSPTFLGNTKDDIEDDQQVSRGMFATSTSQVEMSQLEALKKAGIQPVGIATSKNQPGKLIITFTC